MNLKGNINSHHVSNSYIYINQITFCKMQKLIDPTIKSRDIIIMIIYIYSFW